MQEMEVIIQQIADKKNMPFEILLANCKLKKTDLSEKKIQDIFETVHIGSLEFDLLAEIIDTAKEKRRFSN